MSLVGGVALTWVMSLVGGFAPLTVLALVVRTEDCASWIELATLKLHCLDLESST